MKIKYLLVLWPESQYFVGIPGCYFCQCYYEELDQAMFVPEEIYNEIMNYENSNTRTSF